MTVCLLPRATEIKDLPAQRIYSRKDFFKELYYSILKNILNKTIVHVKNNGRVLISWVVESEAFYAYKKVSEGSVFNFSCR